MKLVQSDMCSCFMLCYSDLISLLPVPSSKVSIPFTLLCRYFSVLIKNNPVSQYVEFYNPDFPLYIFPTQCFN